MEKSILDDIERPKMVFEKTHQNAQLPKKAHPTDVGWDIFAVEDQIIQPNSSAVVKTGLKLAFLEEGYWIKIESRSGMAFKHDVIAFQGVIDNCVPKGTKIYTKNGDINVEDLIEHCKENHIYSFNEESHDIENDRIKEIWVVDDLTLTEIEMEDGVILKIPDTKKVFTKRGWISAHELNINDEILSYYP
jgi:hypothetical protein